MPLIKSAKKALRQSKKKQVFNSKVKNLVRFSVRKLNKNPTAENLKKAYSALDKAIKKNIYHRNKVSRLKSQLAKLVTAKSSKKKASPSKKAPKKKVSAGAKMMEKNGKKKKK